METITLSMEDVRNIKHNLDYKEKNDFIKNYHWNEETKLYVAFQQGCYDWKGNEITIYTLYSKWDIGYAVSINGKKEYLIGVCESMGRTMNETHGLLTFWGREEIVHLWLDNGEFERIRTR